MFTKVVASALCWVLIGSSTAKSVTEVGIRAGYSFGNKFEGLSQGSRLRREGLELGADLVLFKLALAEVRFSPSVVLGGALQSGSDTDGNVYRVVINAKVNLLTTPFYGALGVGYASAQNRGSRQFDAKNGAVTHLTLGCEPPSQLPAVKFYYEASYVNGGEQMSGLSLSVGVKFYFEKA